LTFQPYARQYKLYWPIRQQLLACTRLWYLDWYFSQIPLSNMIYLFNSSWWNTENTLFFGLWYLKELLGSSQIGQLKSTCMNSDVIPYGMSLICSIVHDETLKIHCFLNKWSGSKNHCCIIFTLRHESVMQYQNCSNLFYVKKGCGQMWRKNMCGLIKTRSQIPLQNMIYLFNYIFFVHRILFIFRTLAK
jgi:hypothetical protein